MKKRKIINGKERRKKKIYKSLASIELPPEELDEYNAVQTLLNLDLKNYSKTLQSIHEFIDKTESLHFIYQVIVQLATVRPRKIGLYAHFMINLTIDYDNDKMNLFDIEMKNCSLAQLVGRYGPYSQDEREEIPTLADRSTDELITLYKTNDFRFFLYTDDLQSFKKFIASKQNFNLNIKFQREIEYVEAEDDPEQSITILHLTGFHGSQNCFMFTALNGGKISNSLRHHCAAGGNKRIIHYLSQQGIDFSDCANSALEFHHDDLVDWFLYYYPNQELDLLSSLRYYNHKAIYYCLYNKLDDKHVMKNTSYLHIICQHGYVNLLDYFVKQGLDIDKPANFSFFEDKMPEVPFICF